MTAEFLEDDLIQYEVACHIIGAIIAHYSEQISIESEKPSPDLAAIDRARTMQRTLDEKRSAIDPSNRAAIDDLIATYGPVARDLYA